MCVAAAVSSANGRHCELERLSGLSLSRGQLAERTQPVVLTDVVSGWAATARWATAESWIRLYGDVAGYARDHDQLEIRDLELTVGEYLESQFFEGSRDGRPGPSAAFFVNDYEDSRLLDRLRGDYARPEALGDVEAVRVLSLERPGSGVTFHRHEEAWQAQVAGEKEWFLLPPSVEAVPLTSPCAFVDHGAPPLAERCRVAAGEVLYVPARWWHATCAAVAPREISAAIGGVGTMRGWPPALRAARAGDIASLGGADRAALAAPLGRGEGIFPGGERPLFLASAFGHLGAVELLLSGPAGDVDAPRRDGRTAMHEAARRGDLAVVERLHGAGASLALADASGSTALHHAVAERGDPAVADFLLRHGASASARRIDGRTPLHIACRGHRDPVALLRLLMQGQASPASRDSGGATALMHCAAAGHARGVGLLLRLGGAEAATVADDDGQDALGHALAGRGDLGVVERLVKSGARLHDGRVLAAARLGEPALLRMLVGMSRAAPGALLEAAQAGHGACVEMLLRDFGAAHERSADGATPLHLAALAGHLGAARALLAGGADPRAADQDGMSPMHHAALSKGRAQPARQREVMEALAERAPELWEAPGGRGLTPLHLAAAAGDEELARWLVLGKAVADPLRADDTGLTAAAVAEQEGQGVVAELLRSWEEEREGPGVEL